MSDDFVARVKGIISAIDQGVKLAKRVSRSADSASATQVLRISESAKSVQKALERSSKAINDAYRQNVETCGEPFTKALVEDKSIQSQLTDLRIDLIDQTDKCQDFDEKPESFDSAAFTNIQIKADKCSAECIQIFNGLKDQLSQAGLLKSLEGTPHDDRSQLSSMRQRSPSLRKPVPPPSRPSPSAAWASLQTSPPTHQTPPSEPIQPRNPWSIDSPSQFDLGAQASASLGASPRRRDSRDISPSSKPDDRTNRLIPKEIVHFRLSANEEFLERRRQSRIIFQNELRKSVSSIEENRVSETFSDRAVSPVITSPVVGSAAFVSSPVDGRGSRSSLNGYDTLMTRQRSQGQASQGTRSSRTSSIVQDPRPQERPTQLRQERQDSQDSIFGLRAAAPLSPPLSENRSSGESWGAPLATTLRVPGFGSGVESGLEVVTNIDYDNQKMVVSRAEDANYQQPTPTASMRSIDYPMRHDSSFYKFGGFCEGGKAMIRGEEGFRIVKRPSGHYSATVSARCVKCSYEVGWNDVEKDRMLDRAGIYGNSGIRWRQKFISKCHVRTNSVEEPVYACIFCIEEHKTVEEHDATVFFSVSQLFRHLAKHPRPLPRVHGINVIYGIQPPEVIDFDVHFTTNDPRPGIYNMVEIASKVSTRPSAHAITTHHPKNTRSNSRDPEGNPTLHFATGALIVAITFPEKFGGVWCMGYHDGERGTFPSSAITLNLPVQEDVLMNAQSSLVAFAKWDFKPKDAKDGGWLKFSKGDRITCIGYTFQDQWCWSGQNSKGKFGLFPAVFTEKLQDGGRLGSSAGSSKGIGFGRMPSFPLGRHKSKQERSPSIKDSACSSNGSQGRPSQPGLEVVAFGVNYRTDK